VSEQRDCSGEDEECCHDGFDGQAGNVLLRAGLVDEERDVSTTLENWSVATLEK